MEWLLIDDGGRVWDGSAGQAGRAYAFSGSACEFACYATKHLGFVEIRAFRSGTQIRLASRAVSPKAIAEVLYLLVSWGTRSAVVSIFAEGEGWRDQIISSQQSLLRSLTRFADTCTNPAEAYLERPVRLAHLGPELSSIRARLQTAQGFDDLRALCPALIGDRFTLTRLSLSGSRLLIADIGTGYKFLDRGWGSVVRGLAFEETGDYDYGRSVAEAHHRALAVDEAMVHEVDAFVEWPRRGRTRTCYQRTLLPFATTDGVRWVLSTSTPSQDIDLRAKA